MPSLLRLVTKTPNYLDIQGLEKKIEDVYKKTPNAIRLVKKADYNTKTTEIENKIPNVTELLTIAFLDTKIKDIENKTPEITNFATKVALNKNATEIENKIPDTTNFLTMTRVDFIIKDVNSNNGEAEKLKKTKTTDLGLLSQCYLEILKQP